MGITSRPTVIRLARIPSMRTVTTTNPTARCPLTYRVTYRVNKPGSPGAEVNVPCQGLAEALAFTQEQYTKAHYSGDGLEIAVHSPAGHVFHSAYLPVGVCG